VADARARVRDHGRGVRRIEVRMAVGDARIASSIAAASVTSRTPDPIASITLPSPTYSITWLTGEKVPSRIARETNWRVVDTTMSPACSALVPTERPPAPGSSGIASASATSASSTSMALAWPHSAARARIQAILASVRRQPLLVTSSSPATCTPTRCARGVAPASIQYTGEPLLPGSVWMS